MPPMKVEALGNAALHLSILHGKQPDQPRFTTSEMAVDRQEPMVLQRKCGHPLHALTHNWTRDCC